jgi:hypothetical protein
LKHLNEAKRAHYLASQAKGAGRGGQRFVEDARSSLSARFPQQPLKTGNRTDEQTQGAAGPDGDS